MSLLWQRSHLVSWAGWRAGNASAGATDTKPERASELHEPAAAVSTSAILRGVFYVYELLVLVRIASSRGRLKQLPNRSNRSPSAHNDDVARWAQAVAGRDDAA